jgi:hypothetical protein
MAQKTWAKKVAMSDQEDRLSALPYGVFQHLLGFLPAQEVVRTCVLAQRWRHVWRSVRLLHITCPFDGWEENGENMCLCNFVNTLLLLRGHEILDEVKFEYLSHLLGEMNIWVRHALLCQAQVVIADLRYGNTWNALLEDPPLISSRLRKLELSGVRLKASSLILQVVQHWRFSR